MDVVWKDLADCLSEVDKDRLVCTIISYMVVNTGKDKSHYRLKNATIVPIESGVWFLAITFSPVVKNTLAS